MPTRIKPGYSRTIVSGNIARLMRDGVARDGAIAASYSNARVSFFKRFTAKNAQLPFWLEMPAGYGLRKHYNTRGVPWHNLHEIEIMERAQKKNPAPHLADEINQAARRFQRFTGHRAGKVNRVKVPGYPRAALAVGSVLGIMYSTVRDGRAENYVHRFGAKSRPLLAASPDGTRLYLLGGAYNFTARGIVDRKS